MAAPYPNAITPPHPNAFWSKLLECWMIEVQSTDPNKLSEIMTWKEYVAKHQKPVEAKVVQLVPPYINTDVIQILEQALELAKRGEMISIAYAAEMSDGAFQTAAPGTFKSAFAMLGAIERLKLRFYELHIEEN